VLSIVNVYVESIFTIGNFISCFFGLSGLIVISCVRICVINVSNFIARNNWTNK